MRLDSGLLPQRFRKITGYCAFGVLPTRCSGAASRPGSAASRRVLGDVLLNCRRHVATLMSSSKLFCRAKCALASTSSEFFCLSLNCVFTVRSRVFFSTFAQRGDSAANSEQPDDAQADLRHGLRPRPRPALAAEQARWRP